MSETNEKIIEKLAVKIADESASYDPNSESWWGHDTDIGNLPKRIENHLKEALSLADTESRDKENDIMLAGLKTIEKATIEVLEEEISTLSAKVQELQAELEKWKKQTKAHEKFIGKKLREIDKLKAENKEMLEKIKEKISRAKSGLEGCKGELGTYWVGYWKGMLDTCEELKTKEK